MKNLRLTIVQNSAGLDREVNLARIADLLGNTVPTDLVALPEVFAYRGTVDGHRDSAETIPGPTTDWLSGIAQGHQAWVLGGSIMEMAGGQVFNTSILMDRQGTITATYRKIHLFEAHLEDGKVIREQDMYTAGREPVLVDIEGWKCGMTICYDLRFPELFRHYAAAGAHMMFAPSNFTQRTGKDHWNILVRARAIENQCFLVAPNQCGENKVIGVASYGHSMAVGPWGEALCESLEKEAVLQCVLDADLLRKTRQRIPVLDHRKL